MYGVDVHYSAMATESATLGFEQCKFKCMA